MHRFCQTLQPSRRAADALGVERIRTTAASGAEDVTADRSRGDAECDDVKASLHHWAVAAPFIDSPSSDWISDYSRSANHTFTKVPHGAEETSWHTKGVSRTNVGEWRAFSKTAAALMDTAVRHDGGAITVFPQLAAAAGWRKRSRRLDAPLVAWFFNTTFGRDLRSLVARHPLAAVDRFVVHSTAEIGAYAHHLRLPHDRFSFAHVQYGGPIQTDEIDRDHPFVFATGSGFRDYGTFFDAVGALGVLTKVVAGPRVLAGLTPPSNVEIIEGIDRRGIHRLVRQATVNVLPMNNDGLTAGLITMAEAFRHGRALVVSDRSGIHDYVQHDENALLVPVGDASSMASAIESMMRDDHLRSRLDDGARAAGERRHTDAAAARRLTEVLNTVVGIT